MELFYTHRPKDVVKKLGWMGLKWTKIQSIADLGEIRMQYLEQCLLVDSEEEKTQIKSLNTFKGVGVQKQDPYYICVSIEEIRSKESGDVVGLPERLRGCSPEQLFDGSYRSEGRI